MDRKRECGEVQLDLLFGPFVIPVAGILIGPFLGAVLAELIVTEQGLKQAIKTGVGSLIGFLNFICSQNNCISCDA